MLGVASEEEAVVAGLALEVGEAAELLDAVVAVDRPDAVVLAGWAEDRVALAGQLLLPSSDDALERVHGHEVGIAGAGPLVVHDAALPELVLGLRVGLREVVEQAVEPLDDELVARLCCDEVVLVGEVPVRLGVVLRVHLPLVEGAAVVRVEEHEHLGHLPVAVEHELRRVAGDLDQPVQALQKDIGDVHVHSAVLGQQRQPHQVGVGLLEGGAAVVEEERLVDPLQVVLADVLPQVGLVDLDHSEARQRGEQLDVPLRELVGRVALGDAAVPEQPDQLRQSCPLRRAG